MVAPVALRERFARLERELQSETNEYAALNSTDTLSQRPRCRSNSRVGWFKAPGIAPAHIFAGMEHTTSKKQNWWFEKFHAGAEKLPC
jgi:hypothetical protein